MELHGDTSLAVVPTEHTASLVVVELGVHDAPDLRGSPEDDPFTRDDLNEDKEGKDNKNLTCTCFISFINEPFLYDIYI